ncbi:hypothetical protein ACTU45_14125 [Streptomyces sp. 24-1644]|uniref:hypothetical protein n=1 Tax=unclassified Streptomyces TaxID=2593676 RepID=UPI003648FD1D
MSPRTAPNLPDEGLAIGFQPSPPAVDTRKLHRLYRALDRDELPFLGFPGHLGQVMAELAPLLSMFLDQPNGPYSPTVLDAGTGEYEEAVLTYFAALAGASPEEAHGYVAASPREALLHGLVMGSLTVTFDRPPDWVVDKWRLECFEDLARISTTGPMTHTAVDELAADPSAARLGAVA